MENISIGVINVKTEPGGTVVRIPYSFRVGDETLFERTLSVPVTDFPFDKDEVVNATSKELAIHFERWTRMLRGELGPLV